MADEKKSRACKQINSLVCWTLKMNYFCFYRNLNQTRLYFNIPVERERETSEEEDWDEERLDWKWRGGKWKHSSDLEGGKHISEEKVLQNKNRLKCFSNKPHDSLIIQDSCKRSASVAEVFWKNYIRFWNQDSCKPDFDQ